jgi:hypothetical protein
VLDHLHEIWEGSGDVGAHLGSHDGVEQMADRGDDDLGL